MKTRFMFALAIAAGLFLTSCGGGQPIEVPYEISGATFKLDTPMTPGSNSLQAEVALNLTEAFEKAGANKEKIKSVAIENMSFTMANGGNFDNFQSFVVQIMSDKTDMGALGNAATVNKGTTELKPEAATNEKLPEYFTAGKIYLIIDANLANADSIPYEITGNLKLKFSAAKK